TRPRGDMVTGRHPAFTPEPLPADQPWATPDVASGLRRIHDALGAHADAPSAAWQVWRATSDLMRPWVDPMPAVAATRLMRTSFATTLLDLMLDDPERCATTYNDAARAHPAAGLRPLLIRPDRVELPLWRLRPDGTRLRAYDSDVETVRDDDEEPTTFPPRALMMTAILRLVVCDLFVHGRGGSVYDDAMLAWIRAWLGVDAAPHVLVTATRRLDLGPPDAGPTLDEAIGAYRRRRHDPSLTGGDAPSAAKRRYLDAIEASARGSEARASAFRAMHDWLDASRRADEAAMAELRSSVDRARRMQASRAVRERRTWAFPLYPDGVLDTLRADLGASWSSST
ncbi:MAG: hypothetical protein KDA25_01735, partial [Phycisphaerales bacterium]|nr:hypothetical protein [Phycisphaerales bacterium]